MNGWASGHRTGCGAGHAIDLIEPRTFAGHQANTASPPAWTWDGFGPLERSPSNKRGCRCVDGGTRSLPRASGAPVTFPMVARRGHARIARCSGDRAGTDQDGRVGKIRPAPMAHAAGNADAVAGYRPAACGTDRLAARLPSRRIRRPQIEPGAFAARRGVNAPRPDAMVRRSSVPALAFVPGSVDKSSEPETGCERRAAFPCRRRTRANRRAARLAGPAVGGDGVRLAGTAIRSRSRIHADGVVRAAARPVRRSNAAADVGATTTTRAAQPRWALD